jgi:hypothetical protein
MTGLLAVTLLTFGIGVARHAVMSREMGVLGGDWRDAADKKRWSLGSL